MCVEFEILAKLITYIFTEIEMSRLDIFTNASTILYK